MDSNQPILRRSGLRTACLVLAGSILRRVPTALVERFRALAESTRAV